jgi:hypothetical protein
VGAHLCAGSAGVPRNDAHFVWRRFGRRRGRQPAGRNLYRYGHGEFQLRLDHIDPRRKIDVSDAVTHALISSFNGTRFDTSSGGHFVW